MRFLEGGGAVSRAGLRVCVLLTLVLGASGALAEEGAPAQPAGVEAVFAGPTTSSPIVLSQDKNFIWSVNPDDDSVSVISTRTDTEIERIQVGNEPQSVAVDPNNRFAYVANAAENTVSIIDIDVVSPELLDGQVVKTFRTGGEPWNVVISPNGKRVFVANSAQDTITVLKGDVAANEVPSVLGNVRLFDPNRGDNCATSAFNHFQPRGLAVTADNSRLFVTQFLSFTRSGGKQAADNGRRAIVCRININT
ncbi:MAG TPA: YncE family protein, partial [Ardenticatenaceae bacterium]|nr:YncE family protein [Ardenticatenaceae bacterium]